MKNLLIIAFATISILFSACTGSEKSTDTESLDTTSISDTGSIETAGIAYTCTMHPEVISDKPGKCPKCNMDLVQLKAEGIDTANHSDHKH